MKAKNESSEKKTRKMIEVHCLCILSFELTLSKVSVSKLLACNYIN